LRNGPALYVTEQFTGKRRDGRIKKGIGGSVSERHGSVRGLRGLRLLLLLKTLSEAVGKLDFWLVV
jgi:hypothetical protein